MSTQDWTKTNEAGIYEKNGKYRIRISVLDDRGERHREQRTLPESTTLKEAKRIRKNRIAEIKEPDNPDPPSTGIGTFAKEWLERNEGRNWSASTTAKHRRLLAQKVLPVLGHRTVDELTLDDVREWIDWAEEQTTRAGQPYAQDTLKGWWKVVKKLLEALWRAGHLEREFVERAKSFDGPRSPRSNVRCTKAMTAEELGEFLEAAERLRPGRYPELVTLAYTGMRAGELYALKWDYIDYEQRLIWIRRAHWNGEEKPPKTDEVKRAPLAPVVEEALRDHRQKMVRDQHPGLETGLVFPSDVGTHRYPSSLTKPMRQLSEYIDLGWTASPQNLRRTFVNLMRAAGVSKITRRSIVGHRDDDSEEPYLDVPADEQKEAMDQMLEMLG